MALFNAIKKYQQVNTTSKGLDDGSADVTKDGFLDMLKKGVEKKESPPTAMKQKSVDTNRGQKGGEDKTAVWKALRDDYLMGADLKNIDSGEDDSEARYVQYSIMSCGNALVLMSGKCLVGTKT